MVAIDVIGRAVEIILQILLKNLCITTQGNLNLAEGAEVLMATEDIVSVDRAAEVLTGEAVEIVIGTGTENGKGIETVTGIWKEEEEMMSVAAIALRVA